jgi:hypothetical protein
MRFVNKKHFFCLMKWPNFKDLFQRTNKSNNKYSGSRLMWSLCDKLILITIIKW